MRVDRKNEEYIYKVVSKNIKKYRKEKGLTQEQLAELINIETSSLSGIESGRHFPSLPTLERISIQLNVEIKRNLAKLTIFPTITDKGKVILNDAIYDFVSSLVSSFENKKVLLKYPQYELTQ